MGACAAPRAPRAAAAGTRPGSTHSNRAEGSAKDSPTAPAGPSSWGDASHPQPTAQHAGGRRRREASGRPSGARDHHHGRHSQGHRDRGGNCPCAHAHPWQGRSRGGPEGGEPGAARPAPPRLHETRGSGRQAGAAHARGTAEDPAAGGGPSWRDAA
eukprot:10027080-Alexandrium_andersonii.AAC.1